MSRELNNKKIYVAMSGGVDSSVAAALLKKQDYNVTGVFFKPWQPESDPVICNWKKDRQDALKVAVKLNIPFKTWDFSEEYKNRVTKYMIDSYKKGETPNPDVMCNKEIKFGLFLDKAINKGADYIATGHYIRLQQKRKAQNAKYKTEFQLFRAIDSNKDQSYFLYNLTQKELKHCLFPIGEYKKEKIRKLAEEFGLNNYNKKDSQGICFVGDLDTKEFLKKYIKPKNGSVKNIKGEIIGSHDGTQFHTIGQRHGFNIKTDGGPYYVIRKDSEKNILIADEKLDWEKNIIVNNISWVSDKQKLPISVQVQTRYRQNSQEAKIIKNESSKSVNIKFQRNQSSITPGQSAVFYKGDELLGGGVIM